MKHTTEDPALTVARTRRWIGRRLRWEDRLAELEAGLPPLRFGDARPRLRPLQPPPLPRRRSA